MDNRGNQRGRGQRGRGRGSYAAAANRGGPGGSNRGGPGGSNRGGPAVTNRSGLTAAQQTPAGSPSARPLAWAQVVHNDDSRPSTSRAAMHRESISSAPKSERASSVAEGRGGLRGKREINDVVNSRPANCATKCGTTGMKVKVQTNYFRVLKRTKWVIYQYRVDFSPEVDSVRARTFYLAQHKELLGGFLYEGTMVFCVNHLPKDKIELKVKNREGEPILIKIKKVGIVEATDIHQLQVLNLVLRHAMQGLNLQLVGRNFFDPTSKINLTECKLQLWPGYTTSIRQHEQDVLLCSEIAHKVMRIETIHHILEECAKKSADYQDAFKRLVIGSIVLTDYNNKTYRIDDVNFKVNPGSTFKTKTGEISFAAYYKERYERNIVDMRQPMLESRPSAKSMRAGQTESIMLVPELCRATGITDEMRSDMRLMRAMSEKTRLVPESRIERLKAFNNRLQQTKASVDVMSSWNMELDKNLVEATGRILTPEKIIFGNNYVYNCDDKADWTRELRNKSMQKSINITRWNVITPGRHMNEVRNFVKLCIEAASTMRMTVANPQYEEMRDDRSMSYAQAIDKAFARDPQILMIVLPRKNEEKYSCVKKKCCVDRPIPSQVCVLPTIAPRGDRAKGLLSIATKVVIQMNAKLGGLPWTVEIPLSGLMTVGFDVCHSAKEKNKSFGAMVATIDTKKSNRYYSNVMVHDKHQELSNEISTSMMYALKAYQEHHNALPSRILFYRDGVGDGQLHQVFSTEVNFLREKLDAVYKSVGIEKGCPLAFIVVSKRIHTRYFLNSRNPPPGTVVDDVITLPERYDFFLVSQSVRQGTVSPTSYNVIYDSMGLSADRLQILTYKMTHMYYNWSGTCRVPAVCQYAHKLAFLVAENLHIRPSTALDSYLYFL